MNVSPFAPENDPLDRFLLRIGLNLPAAAQWSRRVGAEARSFRSFAHWAAGSLHRPQGALASALMNPIQGFQ